MQFFRNILHWLKSLFFGDDQKRIRAILMSIFFATIFWFFNSLNGQHTHILSLPVQLQYANGVASDTIGREIRFVLVGKGWKVLKELVYSQEKHPLRYMMPARQQQNYVLAGSLRDDIMGRIDPELQITEIANDTFFINNNRNVKRTVKVYVDKEKLHLIDGFRVAGAVQTVPKIVTFEGSVEKINQLPDSISLLIRDLAIGKRFDKLISLSYLETPTLKVKESVKVTFEVEQFATKKLFFIIEKLNFPESYSFERQEAEIMSIFKVSNASQIDFQDFKITADFNKMHLQDSTLTLQLDRIAQGIEDAKVINPNVKVKWVKK